MSDKSLARLMEFLDYLGDKGLMTKNAVVGRKAAAGKVLGVLDPEEVEDVFTINLDEAMTRFMNLEGKGYTPGSLKSYKSRTVASISDFQRYLEDPSNFSPSGSRTAPRKNSNPKESANPPVRKRVRVTSPLSDSDTKSESVPTGSNVLPIPIREHVVVRIFGLPFDLKQNEANKIANVIKAMAMEPE